MKLTVLLAAAAVLAAAQDTATVEGVVVNSVTGAGIGGASVRLMAPKAGRYETLTDATGAFRITGIKPGDYTSIAEKNGYFGPDMILLSGTRYFGPGDNPSRLRLELNPPAVIRGRVVDAKGNPARASVDLGRGTTVNSDAEGAFRFENLSPGRYTLLARPKTSESIPAPGDARAEMVPTYYPSVVDPALAEPIVARAGAESSGYEIRLQSVPVYRVRGVVLNPDGTPAAKAVVELRATIAGASPDRYFFFGAIGTRQSFSIRSGAFGLPDEIEPFVTGNDGVFEFPSVRSGEWTARAEGAPVWDESRRQSVSSIGGASFLLGRGDPDDLKIRLATPFSLSGVVVLSDGSAPPPGVMLGLSLSSENLHAGGGMPGPGNLLQFGGVTPGNYEIRADVLAGNYYASAILLGSNDVTGQRVQLTSASPPIKVVLKTAGTIQGTIEDADAGIVVLFPQTFEGAGYSVRSGQGRTFELSGIPPGDYFAIALDRFDPRTMADAVRLRSLMPRTRSVRVEQGSTASLELKVNHLPE